MNPYKIEKSRGGPLDRPVIFEPSHEDDYVILK
jgi:hypothetical protein